MAALKVVPDIPDSGALFAEWMSKAEPGMMECRVQNRHLLQGITGTNTTVNSTSEQRKQGIVQIEETCPRCGTTVLQVIGIKDGYLRQLTGAPRYDWPEGYLLPKGAAEGGVMSRDQRAMLRLELLGLARRRNRAARSS